MSTSDGPATPANLRASDPRHTLPASLAAPLAGSNLDGIATGRLGARIYRFRNAGDETTFFLKVAPVGSEELLSDEHRRLLWVQGRLPAPRVLGYAEWGTWVGLLLAAVPGEPASARPYVRDHRVIAVLAELLRQIHAVDIADCPFRDGLEQELKLAAQRMRQPGFNRELFMRRAEGRAPEAVHEELVAARGVVRESVFTHGDYCMPNVMLKQWQPTGVIDWAQAGVGDRSRDLMAMIGSITHNTEPRWAMEFLDAYGSDDVDLARIRYFTLLDYFFASESE